MPEFNLIQRPDLTLRLQQMLGLRQAHITPSLAETVQAVVIMGDVRDTGGERQIVRPAWGGVEIGPAVGLFPRVALHNPAGSKSIITVRSIRIVNRFAAVAGEIFSLGLRGPSFAGFGTPPTFPPEFRHSRAIDPLSTGQVNVPAGLLTRELNAGTLPESFVIIPPAGEMAELSVDVVLLPGWGVAINGEQSTATSALRSSWIWEEEDLDQRA